MGLVAPFTDVTKEQFLDKVFDVPVVLLRQVFWSTQCRKLFRGPQVQFLGKVFGVPVVVQRQAPMGSNCPRQQLRFLEFVHRQCVAI